MNSDGWEVDRIIKSRLQEENTRLKINYDALDELHKELVKKVMELETENQKVWQRYKEEHEQICKALDKITKLKEQLQLYEDQIPSWLDELESMLRGEYNV